MAALNADAQNLSQLVQQSSLIVEAEAVHSRSFWAEGDGQNFGRNIWTETTFAVRTRFKGTTDVFSIVTLGGRVGDEAAHVSHGLSFGTGWKGLLFLTPTHPEAQKAHGIPGTYRVNELATYYYDILNPPTVFMGKAVDNIENDILQEIERSTGKNRLVLDPTFTRKGPRKVNVANGTPSSSLSMTGRGAVANGHPERSRRATGGGAPKIDSLPVITYTMANPQITGTGPFNFEFDLKAHADWDSTRYAKGELWVKYNTEAFGANVAGSGSLLWTEHAFLASGDYTLTAEDKAPNLLKFTIDHTGNLGQALLNQLPTQPEPFIHIKLPVYDLMQLADIEFKADSMQEKSKFRADGLVKYETVIAHDVQVPMAAGALDQALYFTLANMNVVQDGNGDHWFETDILARCSQDSAFTPFSKICLNYDVNVFANMAFSDNYQIIKAGLSDNPNLDLQDFFSNPAIGLMGIQVYDSIHGPVSPTGYPPDALYIHADARLLCRLRMKIANCNAPANVVFNNPLMESNSAFYAQVPTGWNYFFFDPIEGTNSFSAVVCPDSLPVIYSFSPKTITAGTLDTLTILGANFGETAGEVWFRSAEDMQVEQYMKAKGNYYRYWSDDTIVMVVPSAQHVDTSAATGNFYLITAAGDSLNSTETLTVKYSALNLRGISGYNWRRAFLFDQQGWKGEPDNTGGYRFKLNAALNSDTAAKACVIEALRVWRCATGVNFTLDESSTSDAAGVESDTVNVIALVPHSQFLGFNQSGALAVTRPRGLACIDSTSTEPLKPVYDIDILIDASKPWYKNSASSNGIQNTQFDLLSVLIHEVGHATLLNHSLNPGDVMRPTIAGGEIRRVISSNDTLGGDYIAELSSEDHEGYDNSPCPGPMILVPECDSGSNELFEHQPIEVKGCEIAPNPTNGSFTIESSLSNVVMIRAISADGKIENLNYINVGKGIWRATTDNILSQGLYTVQIVDLTEVRNCRLVVIR